MIVFLPSGTWNFHCFVLIKIQTRLHARPRVEPLRPWNVSEVSVSRVPAREWCHLLRGVTWLRQAPFGRFLIANGIENVPHMPAGGNAGSDDSPVASLVFRYTNLSC